MSTNNFVFGRYGSEINYFTEMAKFVKELKRKYKFATEFRNDEIVIVVDNNWISLRFDENDKHLVTYKIWLENNVQFECDTINIYYISEKEIVGASFEPTPNTEDIILCRNLSEAKEFIEELVILLRQSVEKASEYLRELAQIYENALKEEVET